jgi:putative flippase GtrA
VRAQIVIPCYQEGDRLQTAAFTEFMTRHSDVAFTFVNDGSRDHTLSVLESIREQWPERVRVLNLPANVGKAEAVRQGILAALADGVEYLGYWDADLATPLDSIPLLAAVLDGDRQVDIVLGARIQLLGRRIERHALRHYSGRLFATGASLTLGLAVYDTQCGAKVLRRGALVDKLFENPFNSRWIFDVELIARYLTGGGTVAGLYEFSLPQWTDVADSKVRPIDFFRAFGELVEIYNRYPLGQPFRSTVRLFTNAFTRYLGVGAIGTLLHYLVLIVLVEKAGLRPAVGAVFGATAGAIANYYLNYHITFASKAVHRKTFPKFMVVAGVSTVLSGFGVRWATAAGVHYLAAQLVCTVLTLAIGFVVNRLWTYAE